MAKQKTRFTGKASLKKEEAAKMADDILGNTSNAEKTKTITDKKKILYVNETAHKMAKRKAITSDFKTLQAFIEHLIEQA